MRQRRVPAEFLLMDAFMQTATSKLILAAYGLTAIVVGLFGYLFYQSQAKILPRPVPAPPRSLISQPIPTVRGSRAIVRQLRRDTERQRDRITELQRLATKREEILKQQAAELQTQTLKSKQLHAEADRYFKLLMELIDESAASVETNLNTLRGADEFDPSARGIPVGEVDSPTEPTTLEEFRVALMTAEWELEQQRAESDITLADEVGRMAVLRNAIQNAGEVAVPVLVNMLSEEVAEVRVWAATSLGQVGGGSQVAMDALLVAIDDSDPDVRESARVAIQVINGN